MPRIAAVVTATLSLIALGACSERGGTPSVSAYQPPPPTVVPQSPPTPQAPTIRPGRY